jgi:arylsulfatase A-like enzyme
LLAGGPFKRGMIYGASDQFGGYPQEHPVSPEDITATIYQALGIPPETRIYDQLNRPYTLVEGEAILEILK